jgi:hypothetical protein
MNSFILFIYLFIYCRLPFDIGGGTFVPHAVFALHVDAGNQVAAHPVIDLSELELEAHFHKGFVFANFISNH